MADYNANAGCQGGSVIRVRASEPTQRGQALSTDKGAPPTDRAAPPRDNVVFNTFLSYSIVALSATFIAVTIIVAIRDLQPKIGEPVL